MSFKSKECVSALIGLTVFVPKVSFGPTDCCNAGQTAILNAYRTISVQPISKICLG